MNPPASRPYSVVRIYLPAHRFPADQRPAIDAAVGRLPGFLEQQAINMELMEILLTHADREELGADAEVEYHHLRYEDQDYFSPEQPEARIPETARALHHDLGEEMFARMINPTSLVTAQDFFDDDLLEEGPWNPDAPAITRENQRFMWAGSACVPISWLVLFAEENARPIGNNGHAYVDLETALSRIRDAIYTLTWATLPGDIIDELSRTERWLSSFEEGIVELDYGPAAQLLRGDDSPRDLGIALAALNDRDTVTAVAAYRRFEMRWASIKESLEG